MKHIILSLFFMFALEINCLAVTHAVPFSEDLVQRQKKRFEAAQMDEVCRALNIKREMVILDIGTGSGQYAYKFAETLQGTGKVFATDINPDMVDYVKGEAEKKHLSNLTPVLVKAVGVDDFYAQHRYDLIFIAHTLQYIPDHANYLRKMGPFLSLQGHLVILKTKSSRNFKSKDFTDVDGLLKKILNEQPDSPFYKYIKLLQPEAKRILSGGVLKKAFVLEIAKSFNAMAHDGHFFVPFLDKKDMVLSNNVKINPQERDFIDFNLPFFKEFKVQDKERGVDLKSPFLNRVVYSTMQTVNQILILSEFQEFLYGGRSPFLPGGDISYQIESISQDFKSFGYKLVRVFDFIPNEILMEFSLQD